ncbi:polysaccharide ABC transporter ATP-binding protein [Larkinella bovis]|uniref:Polysaccharide ABC transporter ATP-binding protein n=1 Tax=Larkinella bovis TaxID=683041 RepID=A0ABW0IJQ6_9BACT
MKPIIRVENLSKQYRLGTIGTGTIREDVQRWWHRVRGKEDPYLKIGETNDRASKGNSEYVWALKDINFEVMPGEVLGIIGKNGAGKSTLLKILSKVTGPTTGRIDFNGRIGSLLEVGTGFHPDLTGRENIFLNGAILGMTRREIRSKLDEIIDFSGCERYIDTPVKRYSSGMTVRLGFAVAAHLDPEILIVDEVLAVGDAEFQKKAIGKMQDVSRNEGRTVLFVSHNLQAVSALTNRSIVLENGIKTFDNYTHYSIKYYLNIHKASVNYKSISYSDRPKVTSIEVITSHENNVHQHGEELKIIFEITTPFMITSPAISYQIINSNEQPVLHILNLHNENRFCYEKGTFKLTSILPRCKLYPDIYYLIVHFADKTTKTKIETIKNVCNFEVKVFSELRDYYWYPKHATYVEDNYWETKKVS